MLPLEQETEVRRQSQNLIHALLYPKCLFHLLLERSLVQKTQIHHKKSFPRKSHHQFQQEGAVETRGHDPSVVSLHDSLIPFHDCRYDGAVSLTQHGVHDALVQKAKLHQEVGVCRPKCHRHHIPPRHNTLVNWQTKSRK